MTQLLLVLFLLVLAGCGGAGSGAPQGPPPPSGGDVQPPPPDEDNQPLPPTGEDTQSPRLMWDAPSSNTDGSPLTDLAGYRIYYGTEPGTYDGSLTVENGTSIPLAALSATVPSPGLYFLAVSAYDADGNESACSNEISKDL